MDIILSPKELEIKNALVNYIANKKDFLIDRNENLYKEFFHENDSNFEKVCKIWDIFFSIAKDNEEKYKETLDDLDKYIENGIFNFVEKGNISYSYEYYLSRLLLHIDDKVYKIGRRGLQSNPRKKDLDCHGMIEELVGTKSRAHYFLYDGNKKIDSSDLASTFKSLDKGREWRNTTRGFHGVSEIKHLPHELMPVFIECFFISTVVYKYIKDIVAGISLNKLPRDAKILLYKNEDEKPFFQSDTKNNNEQKIPIRKKIFEEETEIIIKIVVAKTGFSTFTKKTTIKRGVFDNFISISRLAKTDPLEEQKKQKELEEKIKKTETTIKEQEQTINKLHHDNEQLRKELKSTPHQEHDEKAQSIGELENKLKKAQEEIAKLEELKNNFQTIQQENDKMARSNEELLKKIKDGQEEIERLKKQIKETKSELEFDQDFKEKSETDLAPPNKFSVGDCIRKHLTWLVVLISFILITLILVFVGNSLKGLVNNKTSSIEQINEPVGEIYPILDGKTWLVKEMEGEKVSTGERSAEIHSTNEEGTDCRMAIVADYASKNREVTFHYNRQTGQLSSPELGEGKVEKVNGFVKLRITFKGWIIEK